MSGILRLESLTKGNTLKQGDKTPLKYRLFDADGEKLNIAGKSAKVRLVYPDFLTIGYEKYGLTVAQDDTVTFTIDKVIPSKLYHVEIIVDDKFIFPSRADESKFTVDKSSLGADANIIEIVGKDVLIQEVKSQVDTELQPLVTSLESAQQAETQRASAESARVSAEEQRNIDHANRSAELAGKADKVVLKNLVPANLSASPNGVTSSTLNSDTNESELTLLSLGVNRGIFQIIDNNNINDIVYVYAEYLTKGMGEIRIGSSNSPTMLDNKGIGEYYKYSTVNIATSASIIFYHDTTQGDSYEVGDTFNVNKRMVINLTQTFGAGNEPTKEEMDELIKVVGYIDEEYTLNNKEMLGYLMKGIRDKADTSTVSNNLYNADTITENMIYSLGAGVPTPSENYYISDWIEVEPNTQYSMRGPYRVTFFDADYNYVDSKNFDVLGDTFDTPPQTSFIRLSLNNIQKNLKNQLNRGSELLPYDDYKTILSKGVKVESESLTNLSLTNDKYKKDSISADKTDFINKSTNLYDVNKATENMIYSLGAKEPSASGNYHISDWINVEESTQYTSYRFFRLTFFDRDYQYIDSMNMDALEDNQSFTTPSKTSYLRASINNVHKDSNVQLNKGSSLLKYEPFYYKLDENIRVESVINQEIKKRFDISIDGTFNTDEVYPDYTSLRTEGWGASTSDEVYQMFHDLTVEHPNYITETHLGDESTGLPIYSYTLKAPIPDTPEERKLTKVFITGGVHGYEKSPVLAIYLLLKQMLEQWKDYPLLEAILFNTEIICIPVANPVGWNNFERVNGNGVDINRNAPTSGWVSGVPDTGTYGGPAPGSELETQYITQIFEDNPDIDVFVDYHSQGHDPNGFIWTTNVSQSVTADLSQQLIGRMSRKWAKEFSFIPDGEYSGYLTTSDGHPALLRNYAYEQGVDLTITLETVSSWDIDVTNSHYTQNVLKGSIETLVNWLLICFKDLQ